NYTLKYGDFRLLVEPSLGADWNDNIYLSKTNTMDDFIVKPAVGVTASYPFSQRNLLYVSVTGGYDRYLKHPSLSTFDLNSSTGTGLSLDVGIKDVTLNLHDWIRYVQDASQNPNVANTADYGTFNNTAGLSATWDLNQVSLSAGYDHQNVLSTSGQFNNVNHSSDMFFARAGFQVHPQINLGLESTATFTRYDQTGASNNALNDNDAYTVGPYMTFQYSKSLSLTARGGYTTYQFQQTSSSIQTSDQNSWYAGLTLSHQPRESISYAIDAGREAALGTESDLTEDWYVRPGITWNFIRDWSFNTSFSYQHGRQGVGNISGNLNETYDWYGAGLSLRHALTSRLSVALNYRLTVRSSDNANDSYTQNLVGLQLTYHPQ
ncbi:MAG TPA: outer membrane beta-barrel protein, partial [Candidatus Binatia bacterium]|nr:outer membrane beta-barrel protein [Candidatus Binatia bacterium]